MKKVILICTIACLLLSCVGCGVAAPEATVAPTAAPTEPTTAPTEAPTEPPHVCQNLCQVCGFCSNEACAESVCAEKCVSLYGEFITTEAISVDTGVLVFDIGENIYVPGNLEEMGPIISNALEKTTGLRFTDSEKAREAFPDGKVHVIVTRDNLYAGQDWYMGLDTSEVGSAYARDEATLSPGDLFLGYGGAIVHELTHVLMYRQNDWSYGQMLNEGLSTYTTYLIMSELEKTAPEIACYLEPSRQSLIDMAINDYSKLYEQPVEYWLDNTFEYASNLNYTVGFRFMAYLHHVYGDYGKWVPAFEEAYKFREHPEAGYEAPVQWRIEVLKSVYGEDVFDHFYPWLQENTAMFEAGLEADVRDLSGAEELNWYPRFTAINSTARMEQIKYKDLRIQLDPMRKYVEEYKGQKMGDALLATSEPVEVVLYYADGTEATAVAGQENSELPLDGAVAFRLVGEGQLEWIEIVGDFCA